jgi:hypothetical protein
MAGANGRGQHPGLEAAIKGIETKTGWKGNVMVLPTRAKLTEKMF